MNCHIDLLFVIQLFNQSGYLIATVFHVRFLGIFFWHSWKYLVLSSIAGVARLEVSKSRIPVFVYAKEPHHYVIMCYIIRMTRMEINESRIPVFVYAKESQL